ncbi:JAB domain-containing protein [Tepidibacter hydrothermalis]|uniref:JAB domain-containing protein n=1 Tax=Tepidibacter hydrothermalis TaxID=3036126 RepID=A0ABY8EGF2_9FIRM|nr:JAB domain-containing protein [Tepidibacter hydrothermalis]WFD10844.1 JAB domain-containing protein [Tepidibacter hydrothermalis]
MTNRIQYEDSFLKSINKLTGIPINKIRKYAKENNPFNILEHPLVVEPNEKQLERICKLNEFIASYNVFRMNEEENRIKFKSPKDAGQYFLALLGGKRDHERFMVAFLDNSNSIIETRTVSEGDIASAVVYPRKILKMAMANDCKSIMIAHNHPGGSINPSREDKALTQRIVDIFQPLDIRVLDHIIVGGGKYSSMAEDGYLPSEVSDKANYEPISLDGKHQIEERIMTYENDFEEDEEMEI